MDKAQIEVEYHDYVEGLNLYIRALLHLIQFISIFGVLFTLFCISSGHLVLSTVAMFIEILLDRGEKVATPYGDCSHK